MTAPDPRPYAAPGDLVTAADAAAFVRVYVVDPDTEWDLSDAYNYLERRLDRERRQACRRGALDAWRSACELVRWARSRRANDWAWLEIEGPLAHRLTRALAFRAAARAR